MPRSSHRVFGLSALCALALLLGCQDYNPYLGASPTVSSTITSITPSGANAMANHPDILLTVTGSGFVPGSNVTWNASGSSSVNLVSNFVSATEMQANLPGSYLANAGTFSIGVIAPGPTNGNNAGNNISNFVPFLVCASSCSSASTIPTAGAKISTSLSHASANRVSPATQMAPRYQAIVADSADGSMDTGTGIARIFLHDSCAGAAAPCTPQIIPISVGWNGADPNGPSASPSVTSSGRFVVFASEANNLVKGDSNGWSDIFLRDTCIGAGSACVPSTTRISMGLDGSEANGASSSPAISVDGRFIAFNSDATNLARADVNSLTATSNPPLFLRDTCFGATAGCVPSTSGVVSATTLPH